MGIIKGGVLGGFRNKTGAVIGSYWRTLDIIKGIPRISGKAPTETQRDQRLKFKLVTSFLSWFGSMIKIGYKSLSDIDTPMNVAVSFHLREAVIGVYPNFTLDYTKVMFSQGRLTFETPAAASIVPAQVDFTWRGDSLNDEYNTEEDRVSFMIFNPTRFKFVSIKNVVARSIGAYSMAIPAEYSGEQVHCYMAMNSVSIKELASNSEYLGLVTVL